VLGSTREGRTLLQFDFDGLFLGEILAGPDGMAAMNVTSLTVGPNQQIHLLDESVPQLVTLSPNGEIISRKAILTDLEEKTRQELAFGTLSATASGLLLPLSSLGTVYEYSFDGEHTKTYGFRGTTTGELNFPVSASMSGNGLVMVLDKQRFNVLCYAPNGKFIGEFGGKGISPGWFYLPSYLAADETGLVYISQVFRNRVQVCRIPDSIQRRFELAQTGDNSLSLMNPGSRDNTQDNHIGVHPNYHSTEGGSQ
jgi:hypothetical protein